jgi:hypothetical protein
MSNDITGRADFNDTWLVEMPIGLGTFETYDALAYNIRDLLNNNVTPIKVSDNLLKIDLPKTVYYWYQDGKENIVLGAGLEKKPQALVVMLTGKNPKYKGAAPFASDLYKAILQDNASQSIRLMSDQSLSDEGKRIWDRLFDMGLNVSVYDIQNPGKSFVTFRDKDEMNSYFAKDDTDYKRYHYVLSQPGEMLAETRSYFNTRRLRELTPGLL